MLYKNNVPKRSVLSFRIASLLALFVAVTSVSCAGRQPVKMQLDVALKDMEGTWHEVARLPLAFENNCAAFSFQFTADGDTKMRIDGFCWYKSMNGPMRRSDATAALSKQSDKKGHFWLQFAGPLVGEYGVLYMSPDRRQMLVGAPDRNHLWILSRDLKTDPAIKDDLIARAKAAGYDTALLIFPAGGKP